MNDQNPPRLPPDRPHQQDLPGQPLQPPPPSGPARAPHGTPSTEKSPVYQRPWFIFIAVIIVIGLFAGGGDDDDADVTAGASDSSTGQPAPEPAPEPEPEPEPAPEPEPEPEPVATFKTVVIEGSGDDIIDVPVVTDVPLVATFTHSGSSNFAVVSFDATGGRLDLLVNDIGRYVGTVPFNFSVPPAELEISANGAWTVTLSDLRDQPVYAGNATGSGDQVLYVTADAGRLAATHDGSSNFVIRSWGDSRSLMVNEIGTYVGTVRLPDALALEINADGRWTLTAQ